MAFRISRSFLLLFFIFSFQIFTLPLPADAALVPCGRTFDDSATTLNESAPCTLCHLVLGTEGVIQWGLKVMTYIAIAVIVAMAILYIVSTGNESLMSTAKSGIWASFIGFGVMLGAWLIVNIVITTLADTSAGKPLAGLVSQGAFRFTCDTASNVGSTSGVSVNPGTSTSTSGGGTPPATGTNTRRAACEDINAAKTRLSGGGTVCNNSGSCPSCNTAPFEALIQKYATQNGLSVPFIKGLIARESTCNPNATKTEAPGKGTSCGLMMVNTPGSSSFTCDQLKDPETGIKEGTRILAAAFQTARSLKPRYGNTVTVEELAGAIHNAGAGESAPSSQVSGVGCPAAEGWPALPKWGCPINPGTAEFNACSIRSYACNVGACR